MSFLLLLLVIFGIQYGLTFVLSFFIENPYIIQLITTIVLSFAAAYFLLPPGYRKEFYKKPIFHQGACIYFIALMVLNFIQAWLF